MHNYEAAGTYQVTLTVTDNRGGTANVTKSVIVLAPNQLPSAAFSWTANDEKLSFDAGASSDPDGTVAVLRVGLRRRRCRHRRQPEPHLRRVRHLHRAADREGRPERHRAPSATTVDVVANVKPTAAFTSTKTFLQVAFDGSGSTDSDGTVADYAWEYGDGATGTGASPNHSYAAAGTYTVKLTVTDDDGKKDSVTHDVTVVTPPPLAADTFGRTVSTGWGTADQRWRLDHRLRRRPVLGCRRQGQGRHRDRAAAATPRCSTRSAPPTTDLSFDVSMDKAATGGGQYFSAIGRNVPGVGFYSAKVRVLATGAVQVYLLKTVGGTETVFSNQTVSGLTYAAGDTLKLRLQVTGTGTTALKVKLWGTGAEPGSWNLSTHRFHCGPAGRRRGRVSTYVSGSSTNLPIVYSFDNLLVPAP